MNKKIVIWLIKSKLSVSFIESTRFIKSKINNAQYIFVAIVVNNKEIIADLEDSKLFDRWYSIDLNIHPVSNLYLFEYNDLVNIINLEKSSLKENEKIYILGIDEINLLSVAKLRDQFNLFGLGYNKIIFFRDKQLMNEHLFSHGFKVPKALTFSIQSYKKNKQLYYKEITEKLGNIFLLKPTQSAGTLGIKKISCFNDFVDFDKMCDAHKYTINEFIYGKQYHCESIIKNRNFIFEACSEYFNPPIESVINGKVLASTPLLPNDPIFKKIIEYNRKILNSLDLPDISSTLEFYSTKDNEFIFIELNGRLPGEPMNFVYYRQFNIWMSYIDFLVQTENEFITDYSQLKQQRSVAWAFMPQIKGEIDSLNTPKLNSSMALKWYVKPGDILHKPISIYSHIGMLIFENKNREYFLEDIEIIKNFNFLTLKK